jgi:hypothetical protein
MLTPRKTRARKSTDKFRLSHHISTAVSPSLLDLVLSTGETKSKTIRTALSTFAHKHKQIKTVKVPDELRPSTDPDHRTEISAQLKPESLLQEYQQHAHHLGINTSELLLRCLYLHTFSLPPDQIT